MEKQKIILIQYDLNFLCVLWISPKRLGKNLVII